MINIINKRIARYFRDKAITQINADPSAIARQYFGPAVDTLPGYGKIESLFWIASFEYNLEMIEFFRNQEKVNNITFDKNNYRKSTEDEHIIDLLLGKGSENNWFLVFFEDAILDLRRGFSILDSFKINVEDDLKLNTESFARIV